MASRRMVSNKIIDSARFIKMPISSQALYFHLIAKGDDDGVVEAFNVMRMIGATEDDLKVLVSKGFVVVLNEDLVSYIADWKEHNLIRADRKIDSIYKDLLLQVVEDVELLEKKPSYYSRKKELSAICQTNDSIGKDSIVEVSLVENNIYSPAKAKQHTLSKKETEKILTDEFEIIWKEYPNKQGKTNALKSYIKARTKDKVEFDVIIDGLKRYLVYCKQNKDWYKPKNGSTWFNQQSWNDEYPVKQLTTRDIQDKIDFSDF
jgi:hypothetical protein